METKLVNRQTLCEAEQDTGCEQAGKVLHETHHDAEETPDEHEEGDPESRAGALHHNVTEWQTCKVSAIQSEHRVLHTWVPRQ